MGAVTDIATWAGMTFLLVGVVSKGVVLRSARERLVLDALSGGAFTAGLLALMPSIYEGFWRIVMMAICLLGLLFNARAFVRIWNRRQPPKTLGNSQA